MGFVAHTQINELAGQVRGSARRFHNQVFAGLAGDAGSFSAGSHVDPVAHGGFHRSAPGLGNRAVPGRPGSNGNGEDVNALVRQRASTGPEPDPRDAPPAERARIPSSWTSCG